MLGDLPDGILGFVRQEGDEATLVLVSCSDDEMTIRLASSYEGTILVSSVDVDRSGLVEGRLRLSPHEAVVIAH